MHWYRAYGGTIESAIELPELATAPPGRPDITIEAAAKPLASAEWIWQERSVDQDVWLRVGTGSTGYALSFPQAADFIVDPRTLTIRVVAAPAFLPDAARHLLLDQVIPMVLSHAGHLVLHASACSVDGEGIAFTGPAGTGKSTLAAACALAGWPLIADDALVVARRGDSERDAAWLAMPSYPGARIWPDSAAALHGDRDLPAVAAYTDKRRLQPADGLATADRPVPLRRVYVLNVADVGTPVVNKVTGRESVMALVAHAFLLDVFDRGRIQAQFSRSTAAAASLDVRTLTYAHDLTRLNAVRRAIVHDLSS